MGDDGAEEGNEGAFVAAVGAEGGLGFGERAEDYVGEGLGEGDGIDEGGDGEHVFARRDWGLARVLKNAVDTSGVKLLLLWYVSAMGRDECVETTYVYDGSERVDHVRVVHRSYSSSIVASHVVGDIGKERGEVCDFEYLIESNELQGGDTGAFQACGKSAIRECALSERLDLSKLRGTRIRESIWERERKRRGRDTGGQCQESYDCWSMHDESYLWYAKECPFSKTCRIRPKEELSCLFYYSGERAPTRHWSLPWVECSYPTSAYICPTTSAALLGLKHAGTKVSFQSIDYPAVFFSARIVKRSYAVSRQR